MTKTISDYEIGINDIQMLQEMFSDSENIVSACYKTNGEELTHYTGPLNDLRYLKEVIGDKEYLQLINDLILNVIKCKEMSTKHTIYENVSIVGLPLMIEDVVKAVMILVVVMDSRIYVAEKYENMLITDKMAALTNPVSFEASLDKAKVLLDKMAVNIQSSINLYKEVEKQELAQAEVENMRIRNEALTSIVQLLEADGVFEEVVNELLDIVSNAINLSSISLTKRDEQGNNIELIGEKLGDGVNVSLAQQLNEMPESKNIMLNNQIYVLPSNESDMMPESTAIINKLNIKAIITLPIMINKKPAMYVTAMDVKEGRVWDLETIRFLADICKMIQSILYRRITKNSIISSYSALKEILDNMENGLCVIDKTSKAILFANETMCKLFGDDISNKTSDDLVLGDRFDTKAIDEMLEEGHFYDEVYDSNRQAWFEIKSGDITWVDGHTVVMCNITNITEKKKYQKRIEFQANNDFLTGLYNRMRCEDDLAQYINTAEIEEKKGALLFIDLDDFKHINDGLGHQYGDALLKMISLGLQQIDGLQENCYRVGGDEFIIIVTPDKFYLKDRILSAIKELFYKAWYINDTEYFCTMSMGIVIFPEDGRDVNDLIKKADIAMYDAKKSGKNRFEYYNAGEEKTSVKRLDIEKNMRTAVAIGCDEFEIYIQPIVDCITEKCIGGEALIRWNNDKLGFLNPDEFIPLAEHLGLITAIGDYFLKKACYALKKWNDDGYNVKINVNLSIVQLLQNDIVDSIRNVINETKIIPHNLVLEVTENLAINDMSRMKKILKRIKELGVQIALDDFGTGYSSLNYIKQMDLDIIKVDRTFIQDISGDDYAQSFVKLITELSQKLNTKVCVEGVEDANQLQILKKLGVSMIQGFYFGKPIPIDKFELDFIANMSVDENLRNQ